MSNIRVVDSNIALCINLVRITSRTLSLDKRTSTTPSTLGSLLGYTLAFVYSPVLFFRYVRIIRCHDFSNQRQTVDIHDDPDWLRNFVLDHSRPE